MASLYIKDEQTAELVDRLARRLGVTKTALVRELAEAKMADLNRPQRKEAAREKLERFWRHHPLPQPTGVKHDRDLYDWLSGEEDVHDPLR